MPNRMPASRGYDESNALLGRSMLSNPLRDFLANYARRDRVVFFEDFLGDTLDLNNFAVAQSATSTNFTVAAAVGGVIVATTAATATASVSLIGPAIWAGNNNASVEMRFKINTVASTWIMEAGFIDAVPGASGPGIVDIDLVSSGTGATMTCGALFQINNAQTHTGFAFATNGGFTGQTLASTLLTTAASAIVTPVADTYLTVKVQLLTAPNETGKSKAFLWINGRLVASHTAAAGAVNGQQALAPWFYGQSVATTSAKVFTVDYIKCSADRSALMAALE